MGRNTNAPFSIFISARLPSLTLIVSASALGLWLAWLVSMILRLPMTRSFAGSTKQQHNRMAVKYATSGLPDKSAIQKMNSDAR
jgi:hypothetical protein